MPKISISVPGDMNDRIEKDLDYGDSKSAWIRQGIRYREAVDEILSDDISDEEKLETLREALKNHDS